MNARLKLAGRRLVGQEDHGWYLFGLCFIIGMLAARRGAAAGMAAWLVFSAFFIALGFTWQWVVTQFFARTTQARTVIGAVAFGLGCGMSLCALIGFNAPWSGVWFGLGLATLALIGGLLTPEKSESNPEVEQ